LNPIILTFLEVCISFGVKKNKGINLQSFSQVKIYQIIFLKLWKKKASFDEAFYL